MREHTIKLYDGKAFGAKFLARYTDEIVYYNAELDIYLWCVTHFGTSWDYVLTDVKLEGCE